MKLALVQKIYPMLLTGTVHIFGNILIKKLGKDTYESIQQKAHILTMSEIIDD